MSLRPLLSVLCAVAAFVTLTGDAGAAARIERAPDFVTKVNQAIDRGASWLEATQHTDGSWGDYGGYPLGVDALAYHTLRVCGVARDNPTATKAWDALRREWGKGGKNTLHTYSAALLLMAIAEHGERVREAGSDREVRLSDPDRQWAEEVLRWLVRAQDQDGTWTYDANQGQYGRGRVSNRAYDNSNTQYGLLGLKAAARCGLSIDARVWKASMQHFLDTQDRTGPPVLCFDPDAERSGATKATRSDHARGWGYYGPGGAYGSMTAGGVGSVVICRSELLGTSAMTKALDAASETSVRDGLAWLGRNFTVRTNPGPRGTMAGAGWHFYYLYAVERAGVFAGVEWMADHDWYGEGAVYLCEMQAPDGGWAGGFGFQPPARPRGGQRAAAAGKIAASPQAVVDVCFALLFLKKGTIPVRRGALTQAGDDSDIRFEAAATLQGKDFDDFVDLILLRWRRSTDDGVRRRLFDGATAVGTRIVKPLLVRMDSPDVEDRTAAHALLRHATGVDRGFDPVAEPAVREEGLVLWQAWWLSAEPTLRYDAATKRLVQ